jgi:hypothetical protein
MSDWPFIYEADMSPPCVKVLTNVEYFSKEPRQLSPRLGVSCISKGYLNKTMKHNGKL